MRDLAVYEAVSQIIPVLLLTVVLEMRLVDPPREEHVGDSLFVVGALGAMVLGELAAVGALMDGEPAAAPLDVVIILALAYGLASIVYLPLMSRVRTLRAAVPAWFGRAVSLLIFPGFPIFLAAAMFGVVDAKWVGVVLGIVVLALVVVGRAVVVFTRRPAGEPGPG